MRATMTLLLITGQNEDGTGRLPEWVKLSSHTQQPDVIIFYGLRSFFTFSFTPFGLHVINPSEATNTGSLTTSHAHIPVQVCLKAPKFMPNIDVVQDNIAYVGV